MLIIQLSWIAAELLSSSFWQKCVPSSRCRHGNRLWCCGEVAPHSVHLGPATRRWYKKKTYVDRNFESTESLYQRGAPYWFRWYSSHHGFGWYEESWCTPHAKLYTHEREQFAPMIASQQMSHHHAGNVSWDPMQHFLRFYTFL